MEGEVDRVLWSGDVRNVLGNSPGGTACCPSEPEEFYGGSWPCHSSMKKFGRGGGGGEEKGKYFLKGLAPCTASPRGQTCSSTSTRRAGQSVAIIKHFVAVIHLVLLSALHFPKTS